MHVKELENLIIDVVNTADHPEILRAVSTAGDDATSIKHTRVRVDFASGAAAHVQVYNVRGPGIPHAGNYEVPKEAL